MVGEGDRVIDMADWQIWDPVSHESAGTQDSPHVLELGISGAPGLSPHLYVSVAR